MYVVTDKGGAIALIMVALVFLGSYVPILSFLERKGRLLPHTFLDYSITNFLGALVMALTLGQVGSPKPGSPNFFTQLGQDNGPSVGFALAGGVLISMGNLFSQYAWPFLGVSATTVPVSCIIVTIGTTMNYFLDGRINSAEILFPGVGCFVIAATFGGFLQISNAADTNAKLDQARNEGKTQVMHDLQTGSRDVEKAVGSTAPQEDSIKAEAGSAKFYKQLDDQRAMKFHSGSYIFSLAMVVFAGVSFGLFSPAINLATNDQWGVLKPGVPHLVVYAAFFYYSCSAFAYGMVSNLWFLYHPRLGSPKSSVTAWLKDWKGRHWALLAGLLCCVGNGFQIMGGQAAGYAASDAIQALPLVSTFWAVLVFKEYGRSSRKTYFLLFSMIIMFVAAVALLVSSAGHRHDK